MATDVALNIASFVGSDQSSVNLNGTRQIAPNITNTTWATDGLTNTVLDFGFDGTTTWATGAVLCELTNPSLSTGQAIAYVHIPNTLGPGIASNYDAATINYYVYLPATSASAGIFYRAQGTGYVYTQVAPPGRPSGSDWRTDINALRVQLEAYRNTGANVGSIATLDSWGARVRVHNRPTLNATGPTATVTTTTRPTVTWTFSGDELSQSHYRVRIFTAAQYGVVDFNPQTSAATVDTDWVASTSTNFTPATALQTGVTYRAYIMAAQTLPVSLYRHETIDGTTLSGLGSSQYREFVINLAAPPTPTSVQPTSGSTVTTDRPTLRATLGQSTVAGATVKAEWQLATNSGFTANVRTLTQADTERVTSGIAQKVCDASSELFQGTWFIRARSIDSNGAASAWTAGHSFTVSHAPTASAVDPTGQKSVPTGNVSFTVGFSDASNTDPNNLWEYMTAYQILVETNGGVGILDTGKQPVSGAPQSASHTASITGYNDQVLRWRARVWDSDDVASSYTAYAQFVPRALPVITAGYPTANAVVGTPTPTFNFTVAGRTISQYRFRTAFNPSGITLDDSSWKTGATASYTPTVALINASSFTLTMQVKDSFGLENSLAVNFTTLWDPPTNPTISVNQANFESNGTVTVTWPQNRDPSFIAYRLYSKRSVDSTYTFLGETTVGTGSTYSLTASALAANVPVDIAVTQVAYRFGVPVEAPQSPITTTLSGQSYYLVGSSANIRLDNVTEDSFAEEWEQEEIKLIGRGRRVEKGTRFGFRGQLSATVYDSGGLTAAQRRAQLETLRATDSTCYLRNPFGDIWLVGVGDIQITRIAGVGLNEYFTVNIPYFEVGGE